MATSSEVRRAAGNALSDIAAKWLRGREAISAQQGSSLVIAGDSAPQRALLALIAECTADMNNLLGRELAPDHVVALSEVFGMWKNQVEHDGRNTVTLLSSHRRSS